MSREHLVRTVANTIAAVGLRFNMTGKQPSDLYHAMAEHLADAQLLQSPETAAEVEAEPLALPWAHVMPDDDLHGFLGDLLSAAIGRWQHSPEVPDREVLAAIERACAAWRTPGQGYRSDEPAEPERPADEDPIRYTLTEQAPVTIYRAEHPDSGITLGHYGTQTAARAHCVAEERRTWAKGETTVFDWIEDEEDGVAELVTVDQDGETETITGYIVTALEVPSEYDDEEDA
jgi:hypothetical protein